MYQTYNTEMIYEFRHFIRYFCLYCYDRCKEAIDNVFNQPEQRAEIQYMHTGFAGNVQKTMQVFNLVGAAWDDTAQCENSLDPSLYKERRGALHCVPSTFIVNFEG
jgi:hypothetical protein